MQKVGGNSHVYQDPSCNDDPIATPRTHRVSGFDPRMKSPRKSSMAVGKSTRDRAVITIIDERCQRLT